jgi:hypothetical protein
MKCIPIFANLPCCFLWKFVFVVHFASEILTLSCYCISNLFQYIVFLVISSIFSLIGKIENKCFSLIIQYWQEFFFLLIQEKSYYRYLIVFLYFLRNKIYFDVIEMKIE